MAYNTGQQNAIPLTAEQIQAQRGKDFEDLQKRSGELNGKIAEAEVRLSDLTLAVDQVAKELSEAESKVAHEKKMLVDTRERIQAMLASAETQSANILLEARTQASDLIAKASEEAKQLKDAVAVDRNLLNSFHDELNKKNQELDAREKKIVADEKLLVERQDAFNAKHLEQETTSLEISQQLEALTLVKKDFKNEKDTFNSLRSALDAEILLHEERVKLTKDRGTFLAGEEARLGSQQEALIAREKSLEAKIEAHKKDVEKMISDREGLALIEQDLRVARINLDRREAQVKNREQALAGNLKN